MDRNPNSPNPQPMGSSFSSPNPETLDSKIDSGSAQDSQEPNPNSAEAEESPSSADGSNQDLEDPKEGEEEEEAECGFCLFMKAGGCKDEFVAWEKCVEDAEKNGDDISEKCFEVTSLLKKCMDAHADYYEPILSAEKAMADSIVEETEKEKAQEEVAKDLETEAAKVEVVSVTESKS